MKILLSITKVVEVQICNMFTLNCNSKHLRNDYWQFPCYLLQQDNLTHSQVKKFCFTTRDRDRITFDVEHCETETVWNRNNKQNKILKQK